MSSRNTARVNRVIVPADKRLIEDRPRKRNLRFLNRIPTWHPL